MNKSTYILGTALSHDGSSCILKDGKIIVAVEKERITKKKHDGFNDNLTIQYCLDAAGITFKDISLIVQENTSNPKLKPKEIIKRSGRIIPNDIPIVDISHHVAHAYSAIGSSPFDEMAVVVMDGQGSSLDTCIDASDPDVLPKEIKELPEEKKYKYWEKESYYLFKNGKLKTIFKDMSKFVIHDRSQYPVAPYDMEHSIAEFYGGISYYVFDDEFCEGKLMGLAPYGRKDVFDYEPFRYENGRVFLNYDWMRKIDSHMGGKYQCFYEYFQYYADLAYFAQYHIEKAVFYIFNSYFNLQSHKNVGYAGGLALNAVANAKILDNTDFENIYIQPAAADNGLSLGCAYYGWCEVLGNEKINGNETSYFGRLYPLDEIKALLCHEYKNNLTFRCSSNVTKETAELLYKGHIIAWYQGESEFGPRALGHRSILASPARRDIRNFINRKIKLREDFRPFAPSVLEKDRDIYFDCEYASPYMLMVARVKKEWINKLPGIVHKDGSARIQTVKRSFNPRYYDLISEFKKLSGISVILNTSLNDRGMPIIETPRDALEFFVKKSSIDLLIIENYIVVRNGTVDTKIRGEVYECEEAIFV